MSDRWQWVDAFRDANIPTAVMMNMPEEDFKKTRLFLIDAGLAPLSYLKDAEKKEEVKDPEQEELDRIIEESKRIKAKREKGNTDYVYNPACFCDQKYNVNTTLEEEEEKKEKEAKKNNDFPKTYVWDGDDEHATDKVIKDSLESKFEKLEAEQLLKQEQEDKQRLEELKQNYNDNVNQSNSIQTKRENMEKLQLLPPEPADGVQMAILLPNNKKVMRKCNLNEDANAIYTIVEGQENMYEKDDSLIPYKIIFGINNELLRNVPLVDQGIKSRNMFKVLLE